MGQCHLWMLVSLLPLKLQGSWRIKDLLPVRYVDAQATLSIKTLYDYICPYAWGASNTGQERINSPLLGLFTFSGSYLFLTSAHTHTPFILKAFWTQRSLNASTYLWSSKKYFFAVVYSVLLLETYPLLLADLPNTPVYQLPFDFLPCPLTVGWLILC